MNGVLSANKKVKERQKNSKQEFKLDKNIKLRNMVIDLIKNYYWKPWVISGRLNIENPKDKNYKISHETIYQWLYQDKNNHLTLYLQKGNKKHRTKRKQRAIKKA
jgi:IS30 family transposase